MYKDLKDALAGPTAHIKYDRKLLKQLTNFRISWMQKSPDYIDFLGGKLLGVHPIRFSTIDEELLFVDILELDMDDIKSRVYSTKDINKSWKISSNPYYNILVYMMYKFYKSSDMNNHDKETAVKELFIIYYYKVMGSLLSRYFSFNANEETAKATIEKLTNKSLIKSLDNWQEVIVYNANTVLPKGIHYKRLMNYNTLNAITILNDTQGRIRDIIKKIYVTMLEVKDTEDKVVKTSLTKDGEDGEVMLDVINRPDKYITYMKGIINVKSEFLDKDLIKLASNLTGNKYEHMVETAVGYIADNIKHDELDIVDYVISTSIERLTDKGIRTDYINNIVPVVKILKGLWTKRVGSDKDLKHNKELMFKLVKHSSHKITGWKVASVSVTVLIYIFIRAIVNKK